MTKTFNGYRRRQLNSYPDVCYNGEEEWFSSWHTDCPVCEKEIDLGFDFNQEMQCNTCKVELKFTNVPYHWHVIAMLKNACFDEYYSDAKLDLLYPE